MKTLTWCHVSVSEAFEEKYPTDWSKIPCFAPVTFFNIEGQLHADQTRRVAGDMCSEAQSYINEREAKMVNRSRSDRRAW